MNKDFIKLILSNITSVFETCEECDTVSLGLRRIIVPPLLGQESNKRIVLGRFVLESSATPEP